MRLLPFMCLPLLAACVSPSQAPDMSRQEALHITTYYKTLLHTAPYPLPQRPATPTPRPRFHK